MITPKEDLVIPDEDIVIVCKPSSAKNCSKLLLDKGSIKQSDILSFRLPKIQVS